MTTNIKSLNKTRELFIPPLGTVPSIQCKLNSPIEQRMLSFKQILILFFIIEGVIFYLFRNTSLLLPFMLCVLLTYLVLFFFSINLQFNFYLKAKNNAKKRGVVLSFDDGPDPEMTPKILDILEKNNAKAIFFLIGENAIKHPDIVRDIINRGHSIGGHTLHHPINFGTLGLSRTEAEIMGGIKALEKIVKQKITFFRPPLGISNPVVATIVKNNKLEVIGWNIRSYDTLNKNAQKMLHRITHQIKSGSSILFHDRVKNTVDILPDILQDIQNKKLNIAPEVD